MAFSVSENLMQWEKTQISVMSSRLQVENCRLRQVEEI